MQRKENYDSLIQVIKENEMRQWMAKHGLGKNAQLFSDDERRILIQFFEQLDFDRSGKVSTDELCEVLTAFGLAETHYDIYKLVSQVDKDRSGFIDFNEFTAMVQGKQSKAIFLVMQKMIQMEQRETSLGIPLPTVASTFRRRMLMASMMATGEKQQHGRRFMKSFTRTVTAKAAKKSKEKPKEPDEAEGARASLKDPPESL